LRYLIISDIHSNLEALEKCLGLANGKFDRAICLGDLVGYGPDPKAVIERVREVVNVIVRGNHDKACCGITDAEDFNIWARLATVWTRNELAPEHIAFLRALPQGPVTEDGFVFVHGSVADEDDYILGAADAVPALKAQITPSIYFGHTHVQGGFMVSPEGRYQSIECKSEGDGLAKTLPLQEKGRYLINPGSVGQPRDRNWRAAFAILDAEKRQVEYYRTAYDLSKTQEKMRIASLPDPLVHRLELGR
jgi:predicted phosphodiesterase